MGVLAELVTGSQRVGTTALPVSQALRVAPAVLGQVEFGAMEEDLGGAGGGLGFGDLGELGCPAGLRVRRTVAWPAVTWPAVTWRAVTWNGDAGRLGDPGEEPGDPELGLPDLVAP